MDRPVRLADVAPPPHLSPAARAVWHRLAPAVDAASVVRPGHEIGFEVLCETVATHERLSALGVFLFSEPAARWLRAYGLKPRPTASA